MLTLRLKLRSRHASALLLLALCTGCSYNHHGFCVSGEQIRFRTADLYKIDASGIHITNIPGHKSLSLGSSKQFYIVPNRVSSNHSPTEAIKAYIGNHPVGREIGRTTIKSLPDSRPWASSHSNVGVTLSARPISFGLGLQQGHLTRVSLDSNTIFIVNPDPDNTFILIEEIK